MIFKDRGKFKIFSLFQFTLRVLKCVIKVRDCCEMIEKAPNEQIRDNLIETLRNVTAGKVSFKMFTFFSTKFLELVSIQNMLE